MRMISYSPGPHHSRPRVVCGPPAGSARLPGFSTLAPGRAARVPWGAHAFATEVMKDAAVAGARSRIDDTRRRRFTRQARCRWQSMFVRHSCFRIPTCTLQSCPPVPGSGGKQPFGLRFARWPALRKTVLDLASSASAAEATATTLRRRRSSCPRGAEGRPLSCLGSACGEILLKQARVLSQPNVLHARLVEIGDKATVPDDRAPIADHADVSVTAAFPSRRFRQIGDRGPVLSTRRPSLDICHRAWQQSASSRGALEAS